MSDLISRKALEKSIREYADDVGCNRGEYELANGILKSISMIKNQPTAYDVGKVVEQLEKCKKAYPFGTWFDMVEEAISIVKGEVC